ncbi:MAG: hypothetical protein GY854_17630 [Deltaproteobacteria bacterium]|nr:hypothetical protein [Deltaproteobacteria bacterium]
MRSDVAHDLSRSAGVFIDVVWPEISPLIGGGDYRSVESEKANDLEHSLDTAAGIDGFQHLPGGDMRSIASRVSYTDKPFDTFTIRYRRLNNKKTEWSKRQKAEAPDDVGCLTPMLTIQAYVSQDGTELLSARIISTADLIEYTEKWLQANRADRLLVRTNSDDGTKFLVVPWSGLEAEDVPMTRWPAVSNTTATTNTGAAEKNAAKGSGTSKKTKRLTSAEVKDYYNRLTQLDIGNIARELLDGRITQESQHLLECDCPRHMSQSRRSLNIMLDKQGWHCFGCATGGDVLQLVEFIQSGVVTKGERGTMPESHRAARDYLAAKAGLPPLTGKRIDPEKIKEIEEDRYYTTLVQEALTEVARFYHSRLKSNPEVLNWVKQKYGLADEIIDKLLIGYADNGKGEDAYGKHCWGLIDAMANSPTAVSKKDLLMSSTLRRIGGNFVPYFDRRVVFCYWSRGRVAFMIGRRTPWTPKHIWEQSKYKKLKVHDLTDEQRCAAPCVHNGYIFNEDCLLKRPERVMITEGVTDCIAAFQCGVPCISPVTTSFRKADIKRLVGLVKRIQQVVICNDSEESGAGEKGALKTAKALHASPLIRNERCVLMKSDQLEAVSV